MQIVIVSQPKINNKIHHGCSRSVVHVMKVFPLTRIRATAQQKNEKEGRKKE
jgi:hypothetical protein